MERGCGNEERRRAGGLAPLQGGSGEWASERASRETFDWWNLFSFLQTIGKVYVQRGSLRDELKWSMREWGNGMERFRDYELWIYAGVGADDPPPLELLWLMVNNTHGCHGSAGLSFHTQQSGYISVRQITSRHQFVALRHFFNSTRRFDIQRDK